MTTQVPDLPEPTNRRDIQGLRVLAVGSVLLNHFWPWRLTGGYVGVDVFFVISGFLITTSLLAKPPHGFLDLCRFWGRRIRRLLPVACLVLLVTLVASYFWAPRTMRLNIVSQTIASAVYVENWALANSATDYFAASDSHTPVQHYWSLSVEEQFYVLWPVVILLLAWARRRSHKRIPWMALGLGAVASTSFIYSIWYTSANQNAAYFVTPTRIWELALGGLVAVAVRSGLKIQRPLLSAATAWVGVGLIVISAWFFSSATAFPGYAALLPVCGTALVIVAASDDAALGPRVLWRWRPMQLIGDISYSVYLWHWPAITLAPLILHHDVKASAKILIVAGVLAVSYVCKRFVEDPIRFSPKLTSSLRRTFVMGLSISVLVGGAALAIRWQELKLQAAEQAETGARIAQAGRCLGAGALLYTDCPTPNTTQLIIPASVIKENTWGNCNTFPPFDQPNRCTFGAVDGSKRVLLIGNSHATQWAPVLDKIAVSKGWSGETLTAAGCYPNMGITQDVGADTASCAWLSSEMLSQALSGGYDIVVIAAWRNGGPVGVDASQKWQAITESQQRILDAFVQAGVKLLVIKDTPASTVNVPDCVMSHLDDWAACDFADTTSAESRDPLFDLAVSQTPSNVVTVTVNDLLCQGGTCTAVIGGIIVYQDDNHISSPFALTLEPRIEPTMSELMDR